ncbi:MAG: 50S ribosomal protein L13 [Candidatus Marsarchaeota archaeon]|nr:50S ribosomal protein L13 [Candidatus Marsarchaeota archaeon]MCL5413472.1 50S ribosomal protein L13 [Candidatus Marsarchaeota archaeon]
MDYVIDGSNKVLGRVASQVAKMLLTNNRVSVVNAESMIMTGHEKSLMEKYKRLIELKDKANPEHSPYWPRRSDLFVKRVIRGMLPYKKPKGKSAFKNLKVYIGVPESLRGAKAEDSIRTKDPKDIFETTMTVGKLMQRLGYNR